MKRLLLAPLIIVAALSAACAPAARGGPVRTTTVESVDLVRYSGTWYELGSIKQFFSSGLSDITANYTVAPDGASVVVVNNGRYTDFFGLESTVVGSAIPVDASNSRLNVSFNGYNSDTPPGNYWIVDLDPDYRWAIVSDPTGTSGFILSRTKVVDPGVYEALVARAAAAGVDVSALTPTRQS